MNVYISFIFKVERLFFSNRITCSAAHDHRTLLFLDAFYFAHLISIHFEFCFIFKAINCLVKFANIMILII